MSETHAWTISGPYHYPNDLHPSFRIDAPDRLVAAVYVVDGDENRARDEAEAIVAALASYQVPAVTTKRKATT